MVEPVTLSDKQIKQFRRIIEGQPRFAVAFLRSSWGAALAFLLLTVAGCSNPPRAPAVPDSLKDQALVLGLPSARTWGDEMSPEFLGEIAASPALEAAAMREAGRAGPLPAADYLILSGGGADGAFAAGILCGWTASGTRPEFKLVTGISTGALIAPFAFLGPEYDAPLKELYTTIRTKDIARKRWLLFAAVFDDAISDTAPLRRLLDKYITADVLAEIARQNARGRLLLISTTNLDARRPVMWNIGAIAASGHPDALRLVRKILLASAAIPAAFPPVLIDVEAGGKKYQEMHVDGGATAQLFFYPSSFNLRAEAEAVSAQRDRRAFIVRNARLDSDWADVQRQTLSIASRAISALIQTQGKGDLYRLYVTCARDGVDFNLAFIPPDFTAVPKEAFDPVYMRQLFDVGYSRAIGGYPWSKIPPGFDLDTIPPPPDASAGVADRPAPADGR